MKPLKILFADDDLKYALILKRFLLEQIWGVASYTNSLALNVQISYLRKALRNDTSVQIESLMKKGYVLKEL